MRLLSKDFPITTGLERILVLLLLALVVSYSASAQIIITTGTAPVSPPSGGFNIDGTLKANGAVGDWLDGTGTGGFVLNANGTATNTTTTFHLTDLFGTGDNIFVGGLKKNDNPNNMGWKVGSPSPAKCDINNVLIHISKQASNGHTWITISGDRQSVSGNSFIS